MFRWFTFTSWMLLSMSLVAQQHKGDSAYKNVSLQVVTICKTDSGNVDAFNFYRSSKISGTEDMLSRIEGVNLIRRGAFGMEPTLRSYSAGQINLTLNGMKMYGACTDKMDPISVYVEPSNLSSVEVSQGASGNSMGSTIGGHINMQLKEATFNCHHRPSVGVLSQYSSVNHGFNEGLMFNVNNEKFALRMNTTYRKANDYVGGGNVLVEHSAYEKVNFNVSSAFKLNKFNTFMFDYIYDVGRNMGYPALTMDVAKAYTHILSITFRQNIKSLSGALLETKVYYNTITHYMDDTHRPETIMHMDMPGWSNTMGAYSQLSHRHQKHQFFVRLDAHGAYTRADMTMYPIGEKPMYMQTLPGNNLFNTGANGHYQYDLNNHYTLETLLRIDYYRQVCIDTTGILQWGGFGYQVDVPSINWLKNGSVAFTHKGKNNTSSISLSYGMRLPTANERFGFYLYNRSDGYDYLGNYLLKPEAAKQIEFKQTVQIKKVSLSAVLFYHYIKDYIYGYVLNDYSSMTIGSRGVKTYNNIDAAQLMGFESSLSFKVFNHFTYKGNARYTYGSLSNNLPMQQVPPLKFIQTIRYQYESMQFQFEHIAAAAQNRINPNFGERVTSAWNTFNIRFAYGKTVGKSVIQLNLAIENIMDANYREHLDWGNIPQPRRNLVIGLNYYLN